MSWIPKLNDVIFFFVTNQQRKKKYHQMLYLDRKKKSVCIMFKAKYNIKIFLQILIDKG